MARFCWPTGHTHQPQTTPPLLGTACFYWSTSHAPHPQTTPPYWIWSTSVGRLATPSSLRPLPLTGYCPRLLADWPRPSPSDYAPLSDMVRFFWLTGHAFTLKPRPLTGYGPLLLADWPRPSPSDQAPLPDMADWPRPSPSDHAPLPDMAPFCWPTGPAPHPQTTPRIGYCPLVLADCLAKVCLRRSVQGKSVL